MGNKIRTLLGAEYESKDGDNASMLHQMGRNIKANMNQVVMPAAKKYNNFVAKAAKGAYKLGKSIVTGGVGGALNESQKLSRTGGPKFTNLGRPPGDWMIPPKNQVVNDSPFNSHGGPHLGEGHDIKKRMQFDKSNRERYDKMPQRVKDSLHAAAWDYGAPYYSPKFQVNVDPEDGVLYNRPIYSDGTMLTYPSLDKPVKRETEINKPPTPLNHCESEMMHEGGWSKMRTTNSPNTVSNKEGIKHNEMMRENIGGFKMPHSPLNRSMLDKEGNVKKRIEKKVNRILGDEMYIQNPTSKKDKIINKRIERRTDRANKFINKFDEVSPLNQGHDIKKDSLGEKEAWAKWEKGYMDRTHKFKGTKFEKPITAEENKKEMEAERHEFKYDKQTGKIRLRKTDDAENPIERKSRCWEGYEPTPGVKAYEPGSCRKK